MVSSIDKYNPKIFVQIKIYQDMSFLIENYMSKTDFIWYYLFPKQHRKPVTKNEIA